MFNSKLLVHFGLAGYCVVADILQRFIIALYSGFLKGE